MMKVSKYTPAGAIAENIKGNEIAGILVPAALNARKKAYAPYSGYGVGAAVLTDDNTVFSGCNIENASYGATVCAERTAIFKAVSEGHTKLKAIAIAGAPLDGPDEIPSDTPYAFPCGICRQVLSEFAISDDIPVIVARSLSDHESYPLSELLPHSFTSESL